MYVITSAFVFRTWMTFSLMRGMENIKFYTETLVICVCTYFHMLTYKNAVLRRWLTWRDALKNGESPDRQYILYLSRGGMIKTMSKQRTISTRKQETVCSQGVDSLKTGIIWETCV